MKRAVVFALLVAAGPAAASDWATRYAGRPLDFSLRFSRHELDLAGGGVSGETTIDRVGIGWRERYGERLQLGLFIDYASLTQENVSLTAGRELTGYHAGVALNAELLRFGRAALFLDARLGYLRVDHDDPNQSIVISWTQPAMRVGVRGPIAGRLRGYGGVRYGVIDGEERLSGDTNLTRALGEDERLGGFAGLELALERDGYVGLGAASGLDRTVRIYFGRRF